VNKASQSICIVCGEERKIRYREFSPHAWTALVHWGELDASVIGQPMCNGCYNEFRDQLMDRGEEVAALAKEVSSQPNFPSLPELPSYLGAHASQNSAQIAS
jgi:hypothetical protein